MTGVYLADTQAMERSAFRLFLKDLELEVVGETNKWSIAQTEIPEKCPRIVVIEWDMLPQHTGKELRKLRSACQKTLIIVLLFTFLDPAQKADLSKEVDMFISKLDSAQHIKALLRAASVSKQSQETDQEV